MSIVAELERHLMAECGQAVLIAGAAAINDGVRDFVFHTADENEFLRRVDALRVELISGSVYFPPDVVLDRLPHLGLGPVPVGNRELTPGPASAFWPPFRHVARFALDIGRPGVDLVGLLTSFQAALPALFQELTGEATA